MQVAFAGDVVGTGSSRKSATNSVLWFFGEDLPGVPNKRSGGICIGNKVAPIFFNTMEDAAPVFEAPVEKTGFGDVIEIRPYDGKILSENGDVLSEFDFKSDDLDEVRADGRINLIVDRPYSALVSIWACLCRICSVSHQHQNLRQGLHAGTKDGRSGLRRRGYPPRYILRTEDDHCRLAGYHRSHDPR